MFSVTTLAALLLLGAGLTSATPTALEKRALGVYMCTDINWKGTCWHNTQLNQCVQLDGNWAEKISALGPDKGVHCQTYTGDNCMYFSENAFKDFESPGQADLRNEHPQWSDVIRSFQCWKKN